MKIMSYVLPMAVCAVLSSCATTTSNPQDPLEGLNRAVFTFNDRFDQIALKPVATAYKSWLPSFVQTGVGNFFGNIGDAWSAVNGYLQGNVVNGTTDIMRVAVNSTLGLGGLLDISSAAGLQRYNMDFGQTLGIWGVGSGPYLVLPLFGPSNIRDAAVLPVNMYGDAWSYIEPVSLRNTGSGIRLIDKRANLLDASGLLEDAALDKYEFIRDAYTQRRQSQINGGIEKETNSPEKNKPTE